MIIITAIVLYHDGFDDNDYIYMYSSKPENRICHLNHIV